MYTVISLDSLDDPRLESFKNAVYVREKWPSWKEFETLMKVQNHSIQKENTEVGEIILGHRDRRDKGNWEERYCYYCDRKGHTTVKCLKEKPN